MKKIILTLLLMIGNCFAQEIADEEYYLIDSLVLTQISQYDSLLIEDELKNFHNTEEIKERVVILRKLAISVTDIDLKNNYIKFFKDYYSKHENSISECLHTTSEIYYLYSMGEYKYYTFEVDSAIVYMESALDLINFCDSIQLKNKAELLSALAVFYGENLSIGKSIEYFEIAINTFKELEDYENVGASLINLGLKQQELNNNEIAESYFKEGILYTQKAKSELYEAHGLVSLAGLQLEYGRYQESDSLCQLALIKMKDLGQQWLEMNCFVHLTSANIGLNEFAFADSYAEKASVIAEEYGASNTLNLINAEKAKSQLLQGNLDSAFKLATIAFIMSEDNNYFTNRRYCAEILSDIHKAKGDYKQALEMKQLYVDINKEMTKDEYKIALSKQEAIYEFQKQKEIDDLKHQQELALEEEKNQKQKIALFSFGGGLLLVGGLLAFIYSRLQIIQKQKVALDSAYDQLEESKKNELAVSNLKALQSQMNPHFIFNALNSVQDLVLLKDIKNSNKYLGKFSDLVRKILLSSKQQFIPLDEEIEILELYLDLEKLRFGDEFKIDFECSLSENEQTEIDIPAMFIQPYIENAIKHGLFHKKGEKQLKVHFFKNNEYLRCEIEDNGVGQEKANQLKQSRLHLHTGFSTEAIENRIRLLNQTLDKKIKVEIIDLLDENKQAIGTKVLLDFPFN